MPILQVPEPYQDMIALYGITALYSGGDLALTPTGDIALNDEGDLRMGSIAHDAMFRLVQSWRYNAPALQMMFGAVKELRSDQARFDVERETIINQPLISGKLLPSSKVTAFHAATDGVVSSGVSRSAMAGAIVVVMASLLMRFRKALVDGENDWKSSSPAFSGVSLGELIVAAANGFRHADEWAAAHFGRQELTRQQKFSIDPLRQAGVIGPNSFVFDASPIFETVLFMIAGDDFQKLARSILGFANELAVKAKERERIAPEVSGTPQA